MKDTDVFNKETLKKIIDEGIVICFYTNPENRQYVIKVMPPNVKMEDEFII